MPVTVRIENRAATVAAAQLGDYIDPRELPEGGRAFAIWLGIIAFLSAAFAIPEATRGVGIGIFVWWLLSVFVYFILAPWLLLRRLRVHGDYAVNSRSQPRLKALLGKGSALLNVTEPEAFIDRESGFGVKILGRKAPHFLILSQSAQTTLSENELDFLVVRCLIHARQNHSARLMLLSFLGDTPPAMRLLAWPVALYATLLRLGWLEAAHRTADRLTLLLRRDHKMLLAAILKAQVESDPTMQERRITSTDVDNFLRNEGMISMEGAEVSTQYKLGSAIHENPTLEDRVRAINAWVKAPEYQAALQKLSESRVKTPSSTQIIPRS